MLFKIQKKIALNLVTGTLGAGKTTMLKNLLKQKPENEKWAILVNEFGAIGIDGAILNSESNSIQISEIPGGCICCTAQTDFKAVIDELVKEFPLDRIFIEPTGLGEPGSMVDMLQSKEFQKRFEVQTVFAVLDSCTAKPEHFEKFFLMHDLIEVADVVVLNKQDMDCDENIEILNNYLNKLYPPKSAIINTSQSVVDVELISLDSINKAKAKDDFVSANNLESSHHQPHNPKASGEIDHAFDGFQAPKALKGILKRKSLKQLDTLSVGWVFENSITFNHKKLSKLFQTLQELEFNDQTPLRAKGVFHTDRAWSLFQWVKTKPFTIDAVAYRRDSRFEILLPQNTDFDIQKFEIELSRCINSSLFS